MKSIRHPIGASTPNFALSTGTVGQTLLSSLRGRVILLVFYRGQWCQSCRRQLGQLATVYDTIHAMGAEVVAVSADPAVPAVAAPELAPNIGWTFPVVSDPELTVIDLYGVRDDNDPKGRQIARPAVFLLDAGGTIRYCHIGVHRQDRPALGSLMLALESLAAMPAV